MGLFDKKRELSRAEFREKLRKASPLIPGAGGQMYSFRKRSELEKEIFGSKYGSHISESEYKRRLYELKIERGRVKTGTERIKIDRQIRYLEGLLK
jgi:hypothetical protein